MKRIVSWLLQPDIELIKPSDVMLFTACDSAYFDYAFSLVRSLDLFSPGSKIVLHIVNPDKDIFARIEYLQALLNKTSLYVSIENVDLNVVDDNEKKTYYASVRFFRIPELLTELNCDILSLDSDSLVVNQIDNDFTDKDEADICLIRRDLEKEVELKVAVATGTIYSRNRPATINFYNSLCNDIEEKFNLGDLPWFLDQVLFAQKMYEMKSDVAVRNIKRKYADWTFREGSIVWAGKGDLKTLDLKFATLQNLLSSNEFSQIKYLRSIYDFSSKGQLENNSFYQKVKLIKNSFKPIVTIYLPRLDLPWKKIDSKNKSPQISQETLHLRIYWKQFCVALSNALEREGLIVDMQEIPAWDITPENVNNSPSNFAFIPHRCKLDFEYRKVNFPVNFYMQEYFSWLFTVNNRGWSAASSIYPIDYNSLPDVDMSDDTYTKYQSLLWDGGLASKFKQSNRRSVEDLLSSNQIPCHDDTRQSYKKFIFFPLQVPHDQSIKYFSDYDELTVVRTLLEWSKTSNIPIVFKPHPVNPKSMIPLIELIREQGGYISDASIHDLIPLAHAVYTINSGVGFEAMFYNVPIVTFGRAEYDCVTFKASLLNLDMAWIYCLLSQKNNLKTGYARFFNWFMTEYAYDLTDSVNIDSKFRYLAKRVKKAIGVV